MAKSLTKTRVIEVGENDIVVIAAASLLPDEAAGCPRTIRLTERMGFYDPRTATDADGKPKRGACLIHAGRSGFSYDKSGVKLALNLDTLMPRAKGGAASTAADNSPVGRIRKFAAVASVEPAEAPAMAEAAYAIARPMLADMPTLAAKLEALKGEPSALFDTLQKWSASGIIG